MTPNLSEPARISSVVTPNRSSRYVRDASPSRANSAESTPTSSPPHFFSLPSMNTVSTAAAPVVDDGRDVGSAQPRGDLVERDQHQILHPSIGTFTGRAKPPVEVDGRDCLTL